MLVLGPRLRNASNMDDWLNTEFFVPSAEVLGVLPIPADVRLSSGIAPFVADVSAGNAQVSRRHDYLAQLQGTRKAVLPVHTGEERALFRHLMQNNTVFGPPSSGQPIWDKAVLIWNQHADSKNEVYYKVSSTRLTQSTFSNPIEAC